MNAQTGRIREALEYIGRGWRPIPVPYRSKKAVLDGWPKLIITAETAGRYFNGERQNIGVVLGEPSGGLVDVDIDCHEAGVAAQHFLPDTGSIFGRAGNPSSHHLFISKCATKKFVEPGKDGETLIELRSTGAQTVFPGSTHEDGEPIEWVCDNGPAKVDGEVLMRQVGLVAGAALVARHWPAGGRHDASLALAGALKRSGWTRDQTELFVLAVAEAARDEQAQDRQRAVVDTYAKDQPTTGWPRLRELLGADVAGQLTGWLGIKAAAKALGVGPPETNEESVAQTVWGSEDALALDFTRRYAEDWRYVAVWGKWLVWTGQHWQIEHTLRAAHLMRQICRDTSLKTENNRLAAKLASSGTAGGAERFARTDRRHAATVDEWDVDPWLLNTPRGVVDLRTGQLRSHRREDRMTKITTATPQGDCPTWSEFLRTVTGADEKLQAYLARVAGYALTGITREHAVFFLFGTGANGKSVFVTTLATVLGDYATNAPMDCFMETRSDRHPTDLAGLRGARWDFGLGGRGLS